MAAVVIVALTGFVAAALADTLVVSNTTDTVNGNTTSPAALRGSPGPDGISLREAIIAANNTAGPHTIRFAPALTGKTILVMSPLSVTRDGVTIVGLTSNGKPAITIDGENVNQPTLYIAASSFTLKSVRFVFVPSSYSTIAVGGQVNGLPASPTNMSNLRFTGNSFSHTGTTTGFAIGATGFFNNRTLTNVVIDNNSFDNVFEGVNIPTSGNGNTINGLTIYRNSFSNMTAPASSAVECGVHDGKNNRMLNIRIAENTFTNNGIGIDLNINRDAGPPGSDTTATGNIISGTIIEGNVFTGHGEAIGMSSGVGNGTVWPTGNLISNTVIRNNVFNGTPFNGSTTNVAVHMIDNQNGAMNNRIKGVTIVNNTINNTSTGLTPPAIMIQSSGGVSSVLVRNTIFWKASDAGETNAVTVSPAIKVVHSIIKQGGYPGANGNFNKDPRFRNVAANNLHLKASSPAIGRGTSTGAPSDDKDCQPRASPPSIGAYELNGPNICPPQP